MDRLGIDVDASGNVFTTGYYTGSVADFDPGSGVAGLPHVNGEDIFVLKLTTAGNFVWAKSMGGDGNENGKSLKRITLEMSTPQVLKIQQILIRDLERQH